MNRVDCFYLTRIIWGHLFQSLPVQYCIPNVDVVGVRVNHNRFAERRRTHISCDCVGFSVDPVETVVSAPSSIGLVRAGINSYAHVLYV